MNNKYHCRAVETLLKQKSHPSLHAFMDAYSKDFGWGHRLLRHNARMMELAKEIYGDDGEREVAFHIACDMGIVTINDIPKKPKQPKEKQSNNRRERLYYAR